MNRFIRRRPSPSMVVSVIALFVALGGIAWALEANSVTSRHVVNDTLKFVDLKNGKGAKGVDVVDESLTGDDIAGFQVLPLTKASRSATNVDQDAARAAAAEIPLFSDGPFEIYAKCYKTNADPSNPGMHGEIFIRTSTGGAVLNSGNGNSTSNGFFGPSTPETDRQLDDQSSFAGTGNPGTLNITDAADNSFYAAAGTSSLLGSLILGTKVGSPAVGDGVFGTGGRCIFGGAMMSS